MSAPMPAASAAIIGGVLPLHLPGRPAAPHSVEGLWRRAGRSWSTYRSARGAFVDLLARLGPRTVWLPAYLCTTLADAARAVAGQLRFYPLDGQLEPDVEALTAAPGDVVLVVHYFGRPPGAGLRALAAARPDIVWVEDRAQALDPAVPPFGDVLLYSPRELLGVPDGGVLVGVRHAFGGSSGAPGPEAAELARPLLLRLEAEEHNDLWYGAYRASEAAMPSGPAPMSRLTEALLARIDVEPVARARRDNYARLHAALADLALFPDPEPAWVPLGLPVRVVDAAALARRLALRRVFCARHWGELPSDADAFAREHRLARELLTLPCDQRYGAADMDRLARMVRERAR
jgi:hypothetical protein